MYVRTKRLKNSKTGKVYEYHQLVQAEWSGGNPRQLVLAHLGKYDNVEEAYAAFRAELDEVNSTYLALLEEEQRYEQRIRERFGESLELYHAGEIPTTKEVEGLYCYRRKDGVLRQPNGADEYAASFGGVEEIRGNPYMPDGTLSYRGFNSYFRVWLEGYWRCRNKRKRLEPRHKRLMGNIRKLEAARQNEHEARGRASAELAEAKEQLEQLQATT